MTAAATGAVCARGRLLACLCALFAEARALRLPSALVSAEWLRRHRQEVHLYDVTQTLDREANTVEPALDGFVSERIPGASFIDVPNGLSDSSRHSTAAGVLLHNMCPSASAFASELARLGISLARASEGGPPIVLYSSEHVMWATRVWWMLHSFGLEGRVAVLDGGLEAWKAAGGELARGVDETGCGGATVATAGAGTSAGVGSARDFRKGSFVDVDHVLRLVAKRTASTAVTAPLLIDSLKRSSFDGTAPSRYGRRGHISGAVSVPYASVLDGAGCFLPAATIRRAFEAGGARLTEDPATIVVY
mmetsp:Transcript_43871/g.115291  ORF Transcript_43871/g.115291 Transcript_43871/m.115291 type:complete len:306 (+) Transcript_43871:147-1064(+)